MTSRPTSTFPRKRKPGRAAIFSNARETVLSCGWSGATPSRTSPHGVGSRSIMSTSTAGSSLREQRARPRRRRRAGAHDRDAEVGHRRVMLRPARRPTTCEHPADVEGARRPDRGDRRRRLPRRVPRRHREGVVGQPAARARTTSCPTARTSSEADRSRRTTRATEPAGTSVADLHGPSERHARRALRADGAGGRHSAFVGARSCMR